MTTKNIAREEKWSDPTACVGVLMKSSGSFFFSCWSLGRNARWQHIEGNRQSEFCLIYSPLYMSKENVDVRQSQEKKTKQDIGGLMFVPPRTIEGAWKWSIQRRTHENSEPNIWYTNGRDSIGNFSWWFIVHRVVRLGRLSERRPYSFLARRGRQFTFERGTHQSWKTKHRRPRAQESVVLPSSSNVGDVTI